MRYKISQYAKIHGVTYRTVWNWIKRGDVEYEKPSTNRIWITEGEKDKVATPVVATYARVSSSQNKNNLERQSE